MNLKRLQALFIPRDGHPKINCIVNSPNDSTLAVCHSNKCTLIEEDTNSVELITSRNTDSSSIAVITSVTFSADSKRVAVVQSDKLIYVYDISGTTEMKKVMNNKFLFQNEITCIFWPIKQSIICCLTDGRIRVANTRTNKSSTIYNSESCVVSIAYELRGNGFLSGHVNGDVVRFKFEANELLDSPERIVAHSAAPYALVWLDNYVLVGGYDRKIIVYDKNGRIVQTFDYSYDESEKGFTTATGNHSSQIAAFGSFDRIRILSWSIRRQSWECIISKEVKEIYAINAMVWKDDGAILAVGTECSGVQSFSCLFKRKLIDNLLEVAFIDMNRISVKNKQTESKMILFSSTGSEIKMVKSIGDGHYVIAQTAESIILGSIITKNFCEIPRCKSCPKGQIYFCSTNFCVVFCGGRNIIVDFQKQSWTASVKSDFLDSRVISLRRKLDHAGFEREVFLAYLLDSKNIVIIDICTNNLVNQIESEFTVVWMEFNEIGSKLLLRDISFQLILYDIELNVKIPLLFACSYVGWICGSNVVVAQSNDKLCIWYDINLKDEIDAISLKGENVIEAIQSNERNEIITSDGMNITSHIMDNSIIEFEKKLNRNNYAHAIQLLEKIAIHAGLNSMWMKLALSGIKAENLFATTRAYAALGYVSKVHFLTQTLKAVDKIEEVFKQNARIHIMFHQFKKAESIFLDNNAIQDIMNMYTKVYKWIELIELAELKGWPQVNALKMQYRSWLLDTGQVEKAADMHKDEGDVMVAANLYLKAGVPGKAAQLALSETHILHDEVLTDCIIKALEENGLYERAGEVLQYLGQLEMALRCYRKSHIYQHAIELCRSNFPSEIMKVEEEWGDYLVQEQKMDSAIHHFIEAGVYLKAAEASISSKQWDKAEHILESMEVEGRREHLSPYYLQLARHYETAGEYKEAEMAFIKANEIDAAIKMYISNELWEQAYKLAAEKTANSNLNEIYLIHAQQLEGKERLKEAERLYLTIKEIDRAIAMYKRHRQFRDMLRLIEAHKPGLLTQTYLQLATEMECEGNLKQAEQYYLEVQDWKSAVNMYRTRDHWEEAYRVATNYSDQPDLRGQVAYLWAKHLGGESAVRLLTRLGLLETAIDMAMEHYAFQFAFDLTRLSSSERLKDVHTKYAVFLEDEGRFEEAESHFVKASKPREAVLMYVHNQDWESAARVAADHDPDSLNDVLLGQGRLAFTAKEFSRAEALLLRARRPDLVVRSYKECGMWEDAIRVAAAYLPNRVKELQEEFVEEQLHISQQYADEGQFNECLSTGKFRPPKGTKNNSVIPENDLALRAREFESRGEYLSAVELYLKVEPNDHSHAEVCQTSWLHAVNVATKFLPPDSAKNVSELVASRLMLIKNYLLASELLVGIGKIRKAVDVLIAGGEWAEALRITREIEPQLDNYVRTKHEEALKTSGESSVLDDENPCLTLEGYATQGKWELCFTTAEQLIKNAQTKDTSQLHRMEQYLHKYVAMYAASLIKENHLHAVVQLYKRYGAPAFNQNFNIYKRLFQGIISQRDLSGPLAYSSWSTLRDVLFDLNRNIAETTNIKPVVVELFERMLCVAHYYALRSALLASKMEVADLTAQISVSLLRYSDMIPSDKAFYEAGVQCRNIGWNSMAFVFFNRYLDLVESIEDPNGSLEALDSADFQGTDIPMEVPLPEKVYTTSTEHEAVKEWVLIVSMDQKFEQSLPKDERGVYVAALNPSVNNIMALPCIVSGYPVLRNGIQFRRSNRMVMRENWERLQTLSLQQQSSECTDVVNFITRWLGEPKI